MRNIENELEKLQYVEIYENLKTDKPKSREAIVRNSILKAEIEWLFDDVYSCKENINTVIENFTLDEGFMEKIISLSIYTANFDKLVLKISQLEEEKGSNYLLNENGVIFRALKNFLKAKRYSEVFEARQFLQEATTDEDKSIIFFFIYSLAENNEDKLQALELAYKQYKKNLAVAKELYLIGETVDVDIVRMLYKLDVNLFNKLSYKGLEESLEEEELNFTFLPLGGGDEIGANSYLVTIEDNSFIVDSGMKIGKEGNIYPDYKSLELLNREIDGVIITHAHLDHCGALIKLYKENESLKFIMTLETRELIKLNLKNSEIGQDELYDLEVLLEKAIIVQFNRPFKWQGKELVIEFYRAGHILGAASILLKSPKGSVFLTGDYTLDNQYTLKGMNFPRDEKIDIIVTENTYGNKEVKEVVSRKLQYERLKKYVVEKINQGKKVLIPAFAIGRAQEIICCLKEVAALNNFRIYVDGAAVYASEIYEKYSKIDLHGRNIHYLKNNFYSTKEEFILEEVMNNRSCVIASSGMLQEGSTSAVYAKCLIKEDDAACILTGYQACDTLGGRLNEQMKLECDRYVMIDGQDYQVKSELASFQLSAHCGMDEILALINEVKPKKVILAHGELIENTSKLYNLLKNNKCVEVYQSRNNELIKFGGNIDGR